MDDRTPDACFAAVDLLLTISKFISHYITPAYACLLACGVDDGMHDGIDDGNLCVETLGGQVAFSDPTWRRPDRLGFNMIDFVVYFMIVVAHISFTSKHCKVVALSSASHEYAVVWYTCIILLVINMLNY